MRKFLFAATIATIAGVAIAQSPASNRQAAADAPRPYANNRLPLPQVDMGVMHAQVILDRLGFTPGVITGTRTPQLAKALRGFQQARGLRPTGELDQSTLTALRPLATREATVTLTLSDRALAGPYVNPLPKDEAEQAKLDGMHYRSPLEKLAEMFHTTPATLVALNSPDTMLRAGTRVVFPNVLPSSRAYQGDLDDAWKQRLSALNVDAMQPQADRIVVDKSDGVLRAYAGERLLAQFPATMGSARDPLPIGNWKIIGIARNPDWKFNPAILKGVSNDRSAQVIPPGPNNPVGVVWHDLDKPHYGIHGTSEPQNIGSTESNGCIRLTNWDAARLSLMVKPGTPAVFQP